MNKILTLLSILAISASTVVDARTTTGDYLRGGMLFGGAIVMMMQTTCSEAEADMWDMEADARRNDYKCEDIFKGFKNFKGLKLYQKTEAIAKVSYSKLKRALISNSVAAGGSGEPPEGCDAHHIVPEHEGRAWAKDAADRSRAILAECNIGLNSPENGVFLPNGKSQSSGCEGSHHPSVHTKEYYENLRNNLERAKRSGGCDEVKNTLNEIKQNLANNSL